MVDTAWWNWAGMPTAAEWTAWWGFLAFAVTLTAAIAALAQLAAYIREREDAARPCVVVDLTFHGSLMRVTVTNTSEAPATNLSLRCDKPFESTFPNDAATLNRVMSADYSVRLLAPGRAISWVLDVPFRYSEHPEFPRTYNVTATYTDPRVLRRRHSWAFWAKREPVTYSDPYELSFDQWHEASADTEYERKIAEAIERIAARSETIFTRLTAGAGARS